jgi:hypothetical protein
VVSSQIYQEAIQQASKRKNPASRQAQPDIGFNQLGNKQAQPDSQQAQPANKTNQTARKPSQPASHAN